MINAQAEDVVSGIRTPQNITKKARLASGSEDVPLEESMPYVYQEFVSIYLKLDNHNFEDLI